MRITCNFRTFTAFSNEGHIERSQYSSGDYFLVHVSLACGRFSCSMRGVRWRESSKKDRGIDEAMVAHIAEAAVPENGSHGHDGFAS